MNEKKEEDIGPIGITIMAIAIVIVFLLAVIGAGFAITTFGKTSTVLNHSEGKVIKSKTSWWGYKSDSSSFIYRQGKWKEINQAGEEIDIPMPDTQID